MPYQARAAASPRLATIAVIAIIATLVMSALGPVASASAAPVAAGFKDHVYGPDTSDPTKDKPQSKVWFADGSWWAGMFVNGDDNENRIHRYNASTHVWTDTGVVVDERNASHADYLWDGTSLYVASVNGDSDDDPILVFKLNYNASTDTYSHDPAFTSAGVIVGTGPAETVTIAKDSTGQLWVTFQNDSVPGNSASPVNIMVNRSLTSQHLWGNPFSIGQASDDDISAIIAFGGNSVGVMWSDQNPAENQTFFYFSTHADSNASDTTWSTKQSSAQGTEDFAEDHVNLKLVATNSGQVLAAVKTNGGSDHIQLLRRNASTGAWTKHVVVGDPDNNDATRPQVVVDETNAMAYVFYTSPESDADGNQAIYYKSASLSTLSFSAAGIGTPFIQDGVNDINNISTSKHNVTSATGLLAIASSETNNSYYHGYLGLGAPAGREVVRVSGPNRFATAAEISKIRFPSPGASFPEVFIATGMNFPDALAAGPAANIAGGPILLVNRDTIPNETKAELTRLGPAKITIVGGTTQVSATVQAQLAPYAASVVRVAGLNRYDTAARISERFAANRPSVFIAAGGGFPDALSAGPAASKADVPILLVEQGKIPNETKAALTRLSPATIYVVGGTGVISDAVKTGLAQYTDSKSAGSVERLSGADRFATNVAVVQKFWTTAVPRSAVANGMNFPDALAEGAYDLPLHLVTPTTVPAAVATDIQRIDPDRIDALGGITQISDGVLNQLRAL